MADCSKMVAALVMTSVLSGSTTSTQAAARTQRSDVERLVQRSHDRAETITLRTTDGMRRSGVVGQLDQVGFELLERGTMTSHYIFYQQVSSTSMGKRIWIASAVVATTAVVWWWLYRNCFFRCK